MILISAGHYPTKPGACFGEFCEFDEAHKWAMLIVKILGEDNSILVPTGVLKDKVEFINTRANSESIAIEIHFNSAKNKDGVHIGRGSESLYYPGSTKGKVVADTVQDFLAKEFSPNRGSKEGYYRMQKKFGPDYFLAKTKCVSVIVEPDFIHLKDKIRAGRAAGCNAIANALKIISGIEL